MSLLKTFPVDRLQVSIFDSRREMGNCVGRDAARLLRRFLAQKEEVNIMFAAAPSQNEVLEALCSAPDIDWNRVNAFHMDEYIGLEDTHPASFRQFLTKAIFSRLPFKNIYLLNGNAPDTRAEAVRYGELLQRYPVDICMLGVGENGHLAFNDPPSANFQDSQNVRVVALADRCRTQQVHDGCFAELSQVPRHALSVTIPCLMKASAMFCSVPTERKAQAIEQMLSGPVSPACPASILRCHSNAQLYLDQDAAGNIL